MKFYLGWIKMHMDDSLIKPFKIPLVGFTGDSVVPDRRIMLPLCLGAPPKHRIEMTNFVIVKRDSSYNMILGRPAQYTYRILPSVFHIGIKFMLRDGYKGTVIGSQQEARACYMMSLRTQSQMMSIADKAYLQTFDASST
ncbi:hypothetical protein ACH5RR_023417 [Cinchona calisaya]|uniref:DNA-directed RNA polymerase n=1 Tax=Cinchona calisaya TaxID=153742 RepID=A0ABD2ZAM0_9GENT